VRFGRGPDPVLLALFEASGDNAHATCRLLRDLLAQFPEEGGLGSEIRDREHEGDRLAHEILQRIAQRGGRRGGFDAADVHSLAVALDDIVDFAEEAADQLGRYGVEAPLQAAEELATILVATAEQVAVSLHAFARGADVAPALVAIDGLEKQADRLVRDSVASLFATGVDPMMVIRWKDILETLEAAVDACKTVANVLEGVGLKRGDRPIAARGS
jgi:uncharacterized protein Yka (UPF0111/DUF47 family)